MKTMDVEKDEKSVLNGNNVNVDETTLQQMK